MKVKCGGIPLGYPNRVAEAIIRTVAKENPEEVVEQVVQPLLKAAEKWEKIHSVEPGSQLALELEKLNGKSLAELKVQAETMAGFLRRGVPSN